MKEISHYKIKLFDELDDTWDKKWYQKDGIKISKTIKGEKEEAKIHIWEVRGGYQCAILKDGSYHNHGMTKDKPPLSVVAAVTHALNLEKILINLS